MPRERPSNFGPKMSWTEVAKRLFLKISILRRACVGFTVHNQLVPDIIVHSPSAALREQLFLPASNRRTQLNQDVFALLSNRFAPGFFVEVGANDGFSLSNTVYLEECFGWDGLLIEANPAYTQQLKMRNCRHAIAAVTDEPGYYNFQDAGLYGGLAKDLAETHKAITDTADSIQVWGTTLRAIFEANSVPNRIDFVSIDVEGAEPEIVRQLCELTDYRFSSGCIEHNNRKQDYNFMESALVAAGYEIVWRGRTSHDLYFIDPTVVRQ